MKRSDIELIVGFLEARFYEFAEYLEDMHFIDGAEAALLIDDLKEIDVVAFPRFDPQISQPRARKSAGPAFTGFVGE